MTKSMPRTLCILGRQPSIGLAELESLFGPDKLSEISDGVAWLDIDSSEVNIDRLGGTIRVCKLLTELEYTDWHKLSDYLIEHVPKHTCCIGPGKLMFGISTYGFNVSQKNIERTGLEIKKAVRASDGRSVRVVPTKGTELSTAQVLHNKMAQGPLGMELILVRHGNKTLLAQTTGIQNIDAYAARDQARPKRDARVGMLPPKLAQIILNLAGAQSGDTVLDPFCGTGVVLQEALLMRCAALGTDIEPRMVDFSCTNLEWLVKNSTRRITFPDPVLEVGDATSHQWPVDSFWTIACETYLGRPFAHEPDHETLRQVMNDVNTIHKKFLQNVARQTPKGFKMCIAVPAWKIKGQFLHLPALDHLEELGYTRVSFKHADNKDLIYHREGQIVGRELVVLVRK